MNRDLPAAALAEMYEVRALIAKLRIDVGDLCEPWADFEDMEDEAAVRAAAEFRDDQVGLSVAGDVAAHRDQFRVGVIVVERSDDELLAGLGGLPAIDDL